VAGHHAEPTQDRAQILFFASETGAGLDLTRQFALIEAELNKAPRACRPILTGCFDVNTDSLFHELNRHRPTVVHFAGKQSGGQVLIPAAAGGVTAVTDVALAGLLNSLDGVARLVIMDTCHSLRCARAITRTVDFAMGVESEIFDDDAIAFYTTFYRAIAAGRSVSAASGQARAALAFRRVPTRETPRLLSRRGADPQQLVMCPRSGES
jgi:hypothetical protein